MPKLGMVAFAESRLKQEDFKFEVTLFYSIRAHLKTKATKKPHKIKQAANDEFCILPQ